MKVWPIGADGLNKWQRRYRKLRKEGRCWHCGKPCAPWYECEDRRKYKYARYQKSSESRVKYRRPRKRKQGPNGSYDTAHHCGNCKRFVHSKRHYCYCKRCGRRREDFKFGFQIFPKGYCGRCYGVMRDFDFDERLADLFDLALKLKQEARNVGAKHG